jgi:hypothetical protein
VALEIGDLHCPFEPDGWLLARGKAGGGRLDSPVSATVEVRFPAAGKGQWALLGARLIQVDRNDVEVAVGHCEDPAQPAIASCIGLLGKPLVPGLPVEYAPGALKGLIDEASPLPVGRVEVVAGAHDLVDSSNFAFRRAGELLRLVLSRIAAGEESDFESVSQLLHRWHDGLQ